MATVTIRNGSWRNTPIEGTFYMLRPWKQGANGGFVTVEFEDGTAARVKCNVGDFSTDDTQDRDAVAATSKASYETMVRENESEEDAIERIRRAFEILDEMAMGAADSIVRGLIVSGPPGIGKSFGVEATLRRANMMYKLGKNMSDGDMYEIVKGAATPIALYQILYRNRAKGRVTVFDDCDVVLYDDLSLNLLKAALDTTRRRTICWNAESRVLRDCDIPNAFDFEGSVIFLTNTDFDNIRSKKIAPHLDALRSRCLYMDLDIHNTNDMLRRIRQIVADGMLNSYNLTEIEQACMLAFIEENVESLRELSLRTVLKVADLYKTNKSTWRELAVHTVMRPEAKWRVLGAMHRSAHVDVDAEGQSEAEPHEELDA